LLTRKQAESVVDGGSSRGHTNFFPKPTRKTNPRRAQLLKYSKTKSEIRSFFRQVTKEK
jgi:hypothetical protein